MELGQFSVSLAVQDLAASREFYEKLDFEAMAPGGDGEGWAGYGETWVILQNDAVVIGLFQKMFEKNILTWNPADVRAIQATLEERGVELLSRAEPGEGPASILLQDPDGNTILLDQH